MVDPAEMTVTDDSPRTMSVFIVDEEELFRRGLVDLLASYSDISVVGTAGSAGEALPQIADVSPQLVLLDARLPEGAGITACRALRAEHPELRCLVLTSFDDDEALLAAVLAGAAGYLVKQIGGSSILDGVRRAGQGETLLDPVATEALLERLTQASHGDVGTTSLLPDERQVLELVTSGSTNAQICDKLLLSGEVVEDLVSSIFVKLGPRGPGPSHLLGPSLRDLPPVDRRNAPAR